MEATISCRKVVQVSGGVEEGSKGLMVTKPVLEYIGDELSFSKEVEYEESVQVLLRIYSFPIVCRDNIIGVCFGEKVGLDSLGQFLGPISFVKACLMVKKANSKKKKKLRLVKNLGDKVYSQPSFYACLINKPITSNRNISKNQSKELSEGLSGGEVLCCL